MIRFKREDTKVLIEIEHGIFNGSQHFSLKLEQGQGYSAELLKDQFQKNLNNKLKDLKEKYYNEGWKDAKAKRKKRQSDNFWGGWF